MGAAADFEINIKQIMSGQSAVSELERTDAAIKRATAAVAGYERDYASAMNKIAAAQKKIAAQAQVVEQSKGTKDYQAQLAQLVKMERAVAPLKEKASAAASGLEKAKAAAVALAQEYHQLATAEDKAAAEAKKLADAEKKATKDADSAVGQQRQHAAAMGGASNNAERLTGKLREMGGPMGQFAGMGAAGIVLAVAIAYYKLAEAVIDATVALVKYVVSCAMAESSQRLLLGGILQNEAAGVKMSATFREIQKATGATADELTDYVRQLKDAKVSGKAMDDALKGLAMRKAATGDAGISKLLEDLKAGKTTAAKFAAEMDKIYGGMVGKKMQGLGEQWEELKRKVADIFGKVNLGPLEAAVKRFIALLDRPDIAAKIVKAFDWVVEVLADAVDWATKFVEDVSWNDVETALLAIGAVVAALSAPILLVAAAAAAMVAPFVLAYKAVQKLAEYLKSLKSLMPTGGMTIAISGMPGAANDNGRAAGSSLVSGLVGGIQAGQGPAADAAAELGRRTYAALQNSLDAHSPSRKAHYLGRMFGAGLAGGQDESAPQVEAATNRLVQIPAQAASSGGGAGRSVTMGNVTITITGVPGAAESTSELRRVLTDLLEGVAIESAAPITEAA